MDHWQLPQGFRFSGVHSGLRSDPNRLDFAVVVSDRPEVTLQLVLSDVDRVTPIVPSIADAMQVLRNRSGFVAADVA